MAEGMLLPARGSTAVVETDRPKFVKWVGNGLGRAGKSLWRMMRRTNRRRRQQGLHLPGFPSMLEESTPYPPAIKPFWFSEGTSPQFVSWWLPAVQLPSWLMAPMQQLMPQEQCAPAVSPGSVPGVEFAATAMQSGGLTKGSRNSKRKERRMAKEQRRERKRQQQQERKARQGRHHGSHDPAGSRSAQTAGGVRQAFSTGMLAHMINPLNTFPMLLYSAEHLLQQHGQQPHSCGAASQQQGQHAVAPDVQQGLAAGAGSSGAQLPQQLLTVGCRHWGNWWDGRGLLRVKIYDFAIYVNGKQAQAQLPAGPLQLLAPKGQQERDDPASCSDLPSLLKSRDSGVDMSLVLKAARDVPLHLLSAEYEKVLRRRLDRVGGSANDVAALKELLASFSDAERLPAAVTCGTSSSAHDTEPQRLLGPAAGGVNAAGAVGGGSVRKGAMIVFERKEGGDVSARVGPAVLGTVRSSKVAEALFDLYLGDTPVSKPAREAAAHTLQRIAARNPASHPITADVEDAQAAAGDVLGPAAFFFLPSSRGHQIMCEGGAVVGRKDSTGGKQQAAAAHGGLTLDDLAACVLHMV